MRHRLHYDFTPWKHPMRVKVFDRSDGATVVLPLDLWGSLPLEFDGALSEIGDAHLDMACLSPKFVEALGLRGYCVATGADVSAVLGCITEWKAPFSTESRPVLEARQK